MILHRPIHMGGLGLHNVKMKALASVIKTFMETTVHPAFTHNLLHSILYRVYVLGDDSINPPPPLPPYYSLSFFDTIIKVREDNPLNVATMSTAQWYRLMVEQEITMVELADNQREYIKSRTELASPTTD